MNLKAGHERKGRPFKGVGEMVIEHTLYYMNWDRSVLGTEGDSCVCRQGDGGEKGG